jgi:hypothetical protein
MAESVTMKHNESCGNVNNENHETGLKMIAPSPIMRYLPQCQTTQEAKVSMKKEY